MSEVLGEEAFARLRPYIDRVLAGEKVQFELKTPYRDGGTRFIEGFYVPDLDGERVCPRLSCFSRGYAVTPSGPE